MILGFRFFAYVNYKIIFSDMHNDNMSVFTECENNSGIVMRGNNETQKVFQYNRNGYHVLYFLFQTAPWTLSVRHSQLPGHNL